MADDLLRGRAGEGGLFAEGSYVSGKKPVEGRLKEKVHRYKSSSDQHA
jgi:hypothetical protein